MASGDVFCGDDALLSAPFMYPWVTICSQMRHNAHHVIKSSIGVAVTQCSGATCSPSPDRAAFAYSTDLAIIITSRDLCSYNPSRLNAATLREEHLAYKYHAGQVALLLILLACSSDAHAQLGHLHGGKQYNQHNNKTTTCKWHSLHTHVQCPWSRSRAARTRPPGPPCASWITPWVQYQMLQPRSRRSLGK